jgi:SAM-dependent methyltransferase
MSPDLVVDASTKQYWDGAAAKHGTTPEDRYYHLDDVVAGGTLMTSLEESAVARATGADPAAPLSGLAGLDVLHLQSHIGVDGIVMARAGARVTCADYSATALGRAQELAARVGVAVETVETDARDLPTSLHGRFDLVYATIGAICWIDDLDVWMRQVALALRPGGALVMVELHPAYQMFDSISPEVVCDFPYGGGVALTYTSSGSYADPTDTSESTTTSYAHSIADVAMSGLRAGLALEHLDEHDAIAFNPRGDDVLTEGPDGLHRFLLGRGTHPGEPPQPLPVAFTYIARTPR